MFSSAARKAFAQARSASSSSSTALWATAASTVLVGVVVSSSHKNDNSDPLSDLAWTSPLVAKCDNGKKDKDKDKYHQKIVIVGGGTAGIGVAAMLRNEGMKDITIVEPKSVHWYQPLWTLCGGGVKDHKASEKPMSAIVPKGTTWLQQSVKSFSPDKNLLTLIDGKTVDYDYLVVAAGMQIDWDKIKGLKEALELQGSGVVSVFDYNYCDKTWKEFSKIKDLAKSTMIFTMSPTVIKCAGAPQKIMWLLEDTIRGMGVRDKHDIQFWTPGGAMFGVPFYSEKLEKLRQQRGVKGVFKKELVAVNGKTKEATFLDKDTNKTEQQKFDLLHVAPHMGAPDILKNSPLSDQEGWVAVDKTTMQSTKFANVFGIGDCCNTPNSKTAAAITSQAPVLVHNLMRHIDGDKPLDGKYMGYASCPLITSRKHVMLAEFGYGGKIMETFDRETGKFPYKYFGTEGAMQQRFFYWLKEQFFPFAYWKLWVHGKWYGTHGPWKPDVTDANR